MKNIFVNSTLMLRVSSFGDETISKWVECKTLEFYFNLLIIINSIHV